MRNTSRLILACMAALAANAAPAHAALNAVDPGPYTPATAFFPKWYQDTVGVPLELCLSQTPSPALAGSPMCVLLADPGFDPALPISFPGNFPSESFWFTADGRVRGVGYDVRLTIALEAAFSPEGFQQSFARIRLRGNVSTNGVYTFTHPYGVEVLNIADVGSRAINYTRDIGIGVPGIFSPALTGDIGPFLIRVDALGNPSPIVIGAETFVGDPNTNQKVTGSPFGTNYFRVEGPAGINTSSDLFAISGKAYKGAPVPTPLAFERATYSKGAIGTQLDVFASSPASATLSVSDSSVPPVTYPMAGNPFGDFFKQMLVPPAIFGPITVTASNTPYNLASMPANAPATASVVTADLVTITKAEYTPATQTLDVVASSSDATGPVTLSAAGFGSLVADLTVTAPATRLVVTGVAVPPAAVTVTSTAGGSDTEEVVILR